MLFDWDKTLADNWQLIIDAVNHTFEQFGMDKWSNEEANEKISLSARELFPTLFFERSDEALEIFYRFFGENHLRYVKPIEGGRDMLEYLARRKVSLGVVSNKKSDLLKKEIQQLEYQDFFTSVIGAGDAKEDKPSKEPIIMAMNEISKKQNKSYGCEDIIYIGDSHTDIETAKNANCMCLIIDANKKQKTVKENKLLYFSGLRELLTYMKKNML